MGYQTDRARLKEKGASRRELSTLFYKTMESLRFIYKYHKISPWAPFKSPLMQIPFFFYFATDIRKIVSGLDLQLARDLSEGGVFWFKDLTDPDPMFSLPILSGVLLYANVEYALGRKRLSGDSVSENNLSIFLKDFFQSVSLFMPCFMATSPAGVQIYLATSLSFTFVQSVALRNESFRKCVNLPPLITGGPVEPELAMGFHRLKMIEREAAKVRGDKEVLGKGVLAPGWTASFEGRKRVSTISTSSATKNDFVSNVIGGVTSGMRLKTPSLTVHSAPYTFVEALPEKIVKQKEKEKPKDVMKPKKRRRLNNVRAKH